MAYQINTLAYNFLQMLDLQASQLGDMESQVNHIVQTVGIHKEKVARREIGILTTNKSLNRQYKIIAPANPERPVKYVRKPIDFDMLDDIGHGVRGVPPQRHLQHYPSRGPSAGGSQYGPGMMMGASQYASSPAPTTKPPTPPQAARYSSSGTLNRGSKEYRTPPAVNPPQLPSNYAPNYPRQAKQYGTLPHQPQVQMVNPLQPQPSPNSNAGTMPRLSSSSMRSTTSSHGSGGAGSDVYGRIQSNTLGRPYVRQNTPPGSLGGGSSNYGMMTRPSQRPPSPPLPPPPMADPQQLYAQRMALQQQQQQQQLYAARQAAAAAAQDSIYGRQTSTTLEAANYARQMLSRQSSQMSEPPQPVQPGWVPKNYLERVTAIYDYAADKDDELSFNEGATIYVLKKNDDGWWEGVMNGVTGLFPGNYVEANL